MPLKRWYIAVGLALALGTLLAACAAMRPWKPPSRDSRGLAFDHAQHVNAKIDCADCHDFTSREPIQMNHQLCGVCHANTADPKIGKGCAACHLTPEYQVIDRKPRMSSEIIWRHTPHVNKEVACSECHGDPDRKPLPTHNLMPDCMKCHGTVNPKLNDCRVCHRELDVNVIPKYHGERRIQHDAPMIWKKAHGRESMTDPQFCMTCHQEQKDCTTCHRTMKPDSHSITWERKTHGLEAGWNRQSCVVCHEENACLKCHRTTKPESHTAGFMEPLNMHCTNCHYPARDTGCVVCHEQVAHRKAMPSIHKLGIYPPDCKRCHPGGMPTRAPHTLNSTVECRVCHQ